MMMINPSIVSLFFSSHLQHCFTLAHISVIITYVKDLEETGDSSISELIIELFLNNTTVR